MVARTNAMWREYADVYDFWCSLGDDHLPQTEGWDVQLIEAIEVMGGTGIAYPDDTLMGPDLATCAVMSADIPDALGWVAYPKLAHYCCDNVWTDLGRRAGCLAYCPEVIVEHLHYSSGRSLLDATYAEAGGFSTEHPDYQAYREWLNNEADADISKISALRSRMVM